MPPKILSKEEADALFVWFLGIEPKRPPVRLSGTSYQQFRYRQTIGKIQVEAYYAGDRIVLEHIVHGLKSPLLRIDSSFDGRPRADYSNVFKISGIGEQRYG